MLGGKNVHGDENLHSAKRYIHDDRVLDNNSYIWIRVLMNEAERDRIYSVTQQREL
jgi:hypothetical protein